MHRLLRSPHQTAGKLTCLLPVSVSLDSADDGVPIALSPLQEPASAGWQVVADDWAVQPEVVQVDDVEVGLVTRLEKTAVAQAGRQGRLPALPADDERRARAIAVPLPGPQLEKRCREASVTDRGDVSAPVAQPGNRELVG